MDLDTPRDRFITGLNHIGYYRLDARDNREDAYKIVTILILALSGKYTDHAPYLRGLVSSLNSEGFVREGRLSEVIVVAPDEIMKKKNMTDVIRDFRAAASAADYYNLYPYSVFSLNIPQCQIVPLHEIVSLPEQTAFLARERLALRDLPMVASSNTPVVWIGGRPGQVIRIRHPSETAGEAYQYCVVSRA